MEERSSSAPEAGPAVSGPEDDRLALLRLQAGVDEALAAVEAGPVAEDHAVLPGPRFDGAPRRDRDEAGSVDDTRTAEDSVDHWAEAPEDAVDGDQRRTAAVDRILDHARTLARSLQHGEVLIGHFMLAMSMEGEAIRILEPRGCDARRLRGAWYGRLGQEESIVPAREPALSLPLRRLLTRAGRHARMREPELCLVAVTDILSELSRAAVDYDMHPRDFAPDGSRPVVAEPDRRPNEVPSDHLLAIIARIEQIERSLAQLRYDPETSRRFSNIDRVLDKVQARLEEIAQPKPPPPPEPNIPPTPPADEPAHGLDGRRKWWPFGGA
jgi:hypothetical protein